MENDLPAGFRKKVYTRLTTSSLTSSLSQSISQNAPTPSSRKLSVTQTSRSICDKLKEVFLPLMIEIFELKQSTSGYKNQIFPDELIQVAILKKHPEEILQSLETIQREVEEARNWCEGVLLQLSKASKEAREMLEEIGIEKKGESFIDSVIDLFHLAKKEGKENEHSNS